MSHCVWDGQHWNVKIGQLCLSAGALLEGARWELCKIWWEQGGKEEVEDAADLGHHDRGRSPSLSIKVYLKPPRFRIGELQLENLELARRENMGCSDWNKVGTPSLLNLVLHIYTNKAFHSPSTPKLSQIICDQIWSKNFPLPAIAKFSIVVRKTTCVGQDWCRYSSFAHSTTYPSYIL